MSNETGSTCEHGNKMRECSQCKQGEEVKKIPPTKNEAIQALRSLINRIGEEGVSQKFIEMINALREKNIITPKEAEKLVGESNQAEGELK